MLTKRPCHFRGGPASELEDELAAQQDAQREAEEAIAEGEDIPGVQSFADRVTGGVSGGPDTGSLAQEFADKEGQLRVSLRTSRRWGPVAERKGVACSL